MKKKLKKILIFKKIDKILITLIIISIISFYFIINIFSPAYIKPLSKESIDQSFNDNQTNNQSQNNTNSIIIPKIGVNIEIFEGGEEALEKGVWHRYPQKGNPENGNNFILTAHRFSIGFTPDQTRKRSPFYNIHLLEKGDEIIIFWNFQKYIYKVEKNFQVPPDQLEIEKNIDDHRLTLYSCTFGGKYDGRQVIFAYQK